MDATPDTFSTSLISRARPLSKRVLKVTHLCVNLIFFIHPNRFRKKCLTVGVEGGNLP